MKKTIPLTIIGLLLGIPLSYYFQPGQFQSKVTLTKYLTHLPDVFKLGADFVLPVVLTCALSALVLGIVGYSIDRQSKKTKVPEKPNEPKPEP